MLTRRLGRTGHESSVAVLGAAAFARATPTEAEAAWVAVTAAGLNHLDVAPRYGLAEERIGPLLEPVRSEWFVGCKTHRRNPEGVRAGIEESLAKLRCDHFDLYQAHGVISVADLDARGPAIEAIVAARDAGLTRFVGITGHDLGAPAAHLEALRRHDLDTVMFPVYPRVWADPQYRADAEALLAEAEARDVGVMAIKAAARRPWGDQDLTHDTWYQPWADAEHVTAGVRFALSTPGVHAICTPGDFDVLTLALDAAAGFEPMTADERADVSAAASEPVIFPIAEHAALRD